MPVWSQLTSPFGSYRARRQSRAVCSSESGVACRNWTRHGRPKTLRDLHGNDGPRTHHIVVARRSGVGGIRHGWRGTARGRRIDYDTSSENGRPGGGHYQPQRWQPAEMHHRSSPSDPAKTLIAGRPDTRDRRGSEGGNLSTDR